MPQKSKNTYDLSGPYGIGYDNKGNEFYFDLEDYDKIKDYYWESSYHGYFRTRKMKKGKVTQIILQNLIKPHSNEIILDHKNRKRNDCRKENLRETSKLNNNFNKSLKKENKSQITGVRWDKKSKKWVAEIQYIKNCFYLGSFDLKEDAVKTRLLAEKVFFQDYAPQKELLKEYNFEELQNATGNIFIINGSGTSGKSSFCNFVIEYLPRFEKGRNQAVELSTVDYVKEVAFYCGWNGEKDEKSRKFLSDLCISLEEYNDSPFLNTLNKIQFFFNYTNKNNIFVNIREPWRIKRFKEICEEKGYKVYTILVTNPNVKQIISNIADASVNNYNYDIYLNNSGTLEDWKNQARNFVKNFLLSKECKINGKEN